ncbi:MAG: hypothetical protein ABIO40_12955 [Devosia sp.]
MSLELPGEFGVHSGNRLNLVQFDGETIVSVRNQDTGQASTTAELRRYIQGHSRPWLSSLLLLTGIVLMLIAVMGLSTYLRELGRPAELRENLATLPRILTFGLPGTILFIVGLVMNWSAGAGNRRITERNDAVLALASDFGS